MTEKKIDPEYFRSVMAYGGAPDPLLPYQVRPQPSIPVPNITIPASSSISAITQKVTVAARIDDDGKLWLRISVDGKHIAEVEGSTTATITVDI